VSDVLFVCVHNAGRSQRAKAIFNQMAERRRLRLRAESAGTAPADHVHANVVHAMAELGLDLAGEKPQLLTNEMVEQAERVVTMVCGIDSAACPAVFVKDVEDWGLPDPVGQPIAAVRDLRDSIRGRVDELLGSLGG
jgi:arsenate reductase